MSMKDEIRKMAEEMANKLVEEANNGDEESKKILEALKDFH